VEDFKEMDKSFDKILIVDFGYSGAMELAQIVREQGVYSEIVPASKCMQAIADENPKGLIFVGGNESSVNAPDAPLIPKEIFNLDIPILAFGYGMNVIAHVLGGKVENGGSLTKSRSPYYLPYEQLLMIHSKDYQDLFELDNGIAFFAKIHTEEYVRELPEGFVSLCRNFEDGKRGGMKNEKGNIYAFRFDPVTTTRHRIEKIVDNVLLKKTQINKTWNTRHIISFLKQQIQTQVQDKKVLLALSGGVDSTVLSHLISSVIGSKLTCVFVNTGLMRKGESEEVKERFENKDFRFIYIDAKDRFLSALKGVIDPEEKRRVIGEQYIRVFEESAREIGDVDLLAQGTIYADVVESGKGKDGKLVKSHHNVGGLPDVMRFKGIVEPFKNLLKAEVRMIGNELGLPLCIISRQPFPGPGLAVRIIGEVTQEKIKILQEADEIWRFAIEKYVEDLSEVSQYFAILTDMRTVGVRNGSRTYGYVLALRAVSTTDFMHAQALPFPTIVFNTAIEKITQRIPEITRIVYDISDKPPATIEWE